MKEIQNPREWFRIRFCAHCKKQECKARGAGIYSTVGAENLMPCIMALLLMSLTEREIVKQFRRN